MEKYEDRLSKMESDLFKTVLDENSEDELDDSSESESEIIENPVISLKRKNSTEHFGVKKIAMERQPINQTLNQPSTLTKVQAIEKIKDCLKSEVLNLKCSEPNTNAPCDLNNSDRVNFFQGFSEVAFSPESPECNLSYYKQINSSAGEINFDDKENLNSEESIQSMFSDIFFSLNYQPCYEI
jgi:hypothetical protein